MFIMFLRKFFQSKTAEKSIDKRRKRHATKRDKVKLRKTQKEKAQGKNPTLFQQQKNKNYENKIIQRIHHQ